MKIQFSDKSDPPCFSCNECDPPKVFTTESKFAEHVEESHSIPNDLDSEMEMADQLEDLHSKIFFLFFFLGELDELECNAVAVSEDWGAAGVDILGMENRLPKINLYFLNIYGGKEQVVCSFEDWVVCSSLVLQASMTELLDEHSHFFVFFIWSTEAPKGLRTKLCAVLTRCRRWGPSCLQFLSAACTEDCCICFSSAP